MELGTTEHRLRQQLCLSHGAYQGGVSCRSSPRNRRPALGWRKAGSLWEGGRKKWACLREFCSELAHVVSPFFSSAKILHIVKLDHEGGMQSFRGPGGDTLGVSGQWGLPADRGDRQEK